MPGSELAACGTSDVLFVGQSESLDKTTFEGTPVSELSGITYDRGSQTYYANADRVAASATSRVFTLAIPLSLDSIEVEVQDLTILTRADGSPSTGGDLDAEGIAVTHNRTLYVASEGRAAAGSVLFPAEIRHYALDGTLLGNVPVPTKFNVAPAGEAASNLGLESMALSPNGRSLFTANEIAVPDALKRASDVVAGVLGPAAVR